jgi:hypothetical protein
MMRWLGIFFLVMYAACAQAQDAAPADAPAAVPEIAAAPPAAENPPVGDPTAVPPAPADAAPPPAPVAPETATPTVENGPPAPAPEAVPVPEAAPAAVAAPAEAPAIPTAPAEVAAPPLPPVPAAVMGVPQPPPVPAAPGQAATDGTPLPEAMAPVPRLKGYNSIMYRQAEIAQMLQAIDIFRRNKKLAEEMKDQQSGDDYLSALEKNRGYTSFPQFSLSAIAYHAAGDWTLWLNDRRVTPQDGPADAELTVKSVDKLKATFEWRPKAFARFVKQFADSNKALSADVGAETFTFTLYPNQAFSSYTMTIIEGTLSAERRVEGKPGSPAPAKAGPALLPAPVAVKAPAAAAPAGLRPAVKTPTTPPKAEKPK